MIAYLEEEYNDEFEEIDEDLIWEDEWEYDTWVISEDDEI